MKNTLTLILIIFSTINLYPFYPYPKIQAQLDQPAAVYAVAWKPDGSQFAILAHDKVKIYNHAMEIIQSIAIEAPVAVIVWSPDGTNLIVGRQILDALTFEVLITIDSEIDLGGWSHDGSQVFTLSSDSMGGVAIFNAVDGKLLKTISPGQIMIKGAAWSPDSTRFATIFGLHELAILDVASERITATYPQTVSIGTLAWSPDSTRIATATMIEVPAGTPDSISTASGFVLLEVYVWDPETGEVVNHFSGLPEYPMVLRWHPAGNELAGGAANGAVYVWDLSINQQIDYFLSSGALQTMSYSPYGGRLAVGSNLAMLQYADPARRIRPKIAHLVQRLPDTSLELFVPAPSVRDLIYIIKACNLSSPISQQLMWLTTSDQLASLKHYIELASEDQIPPACTTDLIAVAEAIIKP
jgi:WD40 repeat protein